MNKIDKIVYILKPAIDEYPPCISQIRMIKDLGYKVEVWYGYCGQATLLLLRDNGISLKKLKFPPDSKRSKFGKMKNWLLFRKSVLSAMKKENLSKTIFWFGTAESAIPLYPLTRKYRMVLSVLELMDTNGFSRTLSARIARKCEAVTACEDNRANIMQFWWGLKRKPYVLPNKPYEINIEKNAKPTCDETEDALSLIGDRPFVIYQGIFQNVEYVEAVARALKQNNDGILLVMMGSDRRNIVPHIQDLYSGTIFLPHIKAPKHLEVTSHALIGVVCYDHATLNKMYCAPNKIFEYSKFGVPMLANDVPGLINTVGASGAGLCVDFTTHNVSAALKEILNDYEVFEQNALAFYDTVDNKKAIRSLLDDIQK